MIGMAKTDNLFTPTGSEDSKREVEKHTNKVNLVVEGGALLHAK